MPRRSVGLGLCRTQYGTRRPLPTHHPRELHRRRVGAQDGSHILPGMAPEDFACLFGDSHREHLSRLEIGLPSTLAQTDRPLQTNHILRRKIATRRLAARGAVTRRPAHSGPRSQPRAPLHQGEKGIECGHRESGRPPPIATLRPAAPLAGFGGLFAFHAGWLGSPRIADGT